MNIKLLEEMRREVQERLKKTKGQNFMEIKRDVLNLHKMKGEERSEYSSLLSKHFGSRGGRAKFRKKILADAIIDRKILEAQELEAEEAKRSGNVFPD